jgi:pyruvate dehydrogenase complex dehydrogenase (E1) component
MHNKNNKGLLLHKSRKTSTKMATVQNLKLLIKNMEFHPRVNVTCGEP